jgi:hypothetical protein
MGLDVVIETFRPLRMSRRLSGTTTRYLILPDCIRIARQSLRDESRRCVPILPWSVREISEPRLVALYEQGNHPLPFVSDDQKDVGQFQARWMSKSRRLKDRGGSFLKNLVIGTIPGLYISRPFADE